VIVVAAALVWLTLPGRPLGAIERGGGGPPTVVLLHGYGSNANDWLQFEQAWTFPAATRRIYPQAPLRGPGGRRGWWWLGLEWYVPPGERLPDMTAASPNGIATAAAMVRALLKDLEQPIILGGFSQGAMTSAEIAFHTDQPLAGLVLIGGTSVNEDSWAERFASRRHLPVFIAHGRNDGVLSFAIAERFQQRLKASGIDVTWLPFEGGHDIPAEVVAGVNAFVRRVVQLQSPPERN